MKYTVFILCFSIVCIVGIVSILIASEEKEADILVTSDEGCPIRPDNVVDIVIQHVFMPEETRYTRVNARVFCHKNRKPASISVELYPRDADRVETVTIVLKEDYELMNGAVTVKLIGEDIPELLRPRIVEIVKRTVLLPAEVPYREAKVQLLATGADGTRALVVYLSRKDIYLFETATIRVDSDFYVLSIEREETE